MKVLGYSERGALNSLLYEIVHSNKGDLLLSCLIARASFPLTERGPIFETATVLVEQSLSEFGDADAIIFTTSDAGNCTIFVEAKVLAQAKDWELSTEFSKFQNGLESTVASSNLFTQMYHKQRLVLALKKGGIAKLEDGVEFPPCSTRERRRIGKNPVVRKAVELVQQHADHVFYLALVPDTEPRLCAFFDKELRNVSLPLVPEWDVSQYGYLAWAAVKSFCEQFQLTETLSVFEYNCGQIFPED